MAKFIVSLVSARQQQTAALLAGAVAFLLLCLLVAGVAKEVAAIAIERESREILQPMIDRKYLVQKAFALLERDATAEPCSPLFLDQMRRISLLPDGLHEFVYVGEAGIACSVTQGRLASPVPLREADATLSGPSGPIEFWAEREMTDLGFAGVVSSIVKGGPFAVLYPKPKDDLPLVSWLQYEWGIEDDRRSFLPRGGVAGIYDSNVGSNVLDLFSLSPAVRGIYCDTPNGGICVATVVPILPLLAKGWPILLAALFLTALAAMGVASQVRAAVARRWSLKSRFLRTLGPDTIQCLYQPIVNLKTGEIEACEVLARWRDVDGSTVFPDCFIPIVEGSHRTFEFTRLVVDRAYRELSQIDTGSTPLYVTFNIFPSDLQEPGLSDVFSDFVADCERFVPVAELVESEAIDVKTMQSRVDMLRASGTKVLIDDFGAGYSNIKNLVDLSVDGVKIDRSFAMAADGTVAARMLDLAVEMVHAAGRTIIVEGIETQERLEKLRRHHPAVDFVQGFHLSRPVDVATFERLRAEAEQRPSRSLAGRAPATAGEEAKVEAFA
ncbi:EAL domain-containing protein [Jiella avicenniae]|uniref:EAL domain-containing protein n=1 Tax=Jiella avicenniae TaxID=2907202 RepID=A0A9X1P0Z2_9HYPH|nr:EAL domain-containing protein [Jiella avicenniae]MCE7028538.1 EAL domain-containing protein [Jiella avicenniae]